MERVSASMRRTAPLRMSDGNVIATGQERLTASSLSVGTDAFSIHSPGGSSIIECAEPYLYVEFTGQAGILQVINGNFQCNGLTATYGKHQHGGFNVAGALQSFSGNANVGSLQVAGAAPAGQVLVGNGSTYVPSATFGPSGIPTDHTSSRFFGSSYQNNTGRAIAVALTYSVGNGGATVKAFIGSGSASMLVAGQDRINAGGTYDYTFMLFFIVPAGWFYQAQETAGNTGSPTISAWIEYQL